MVGEKDLRAALPHVARTGLLLVHAEVAGPVDAATERLSNADWRYYATYLQSRPDEAELSAIRLMLSLCREYGFRLHVVHLSTSRALTELSAGRSEGLPLSVETCPHYLHLVAEDVANGDTLSKCAPPIRSRENCEALWQGLREGLIDLVATDHSLSASYEAAGGGKLQNSMGQDFRSFGGASGNGLRLAGADYAAGNCTVDGGGSGAVSGCDQSKVELLRATMPTWLCLIRRRDFR
jgi:allantoinase